MAEAGVLVAWMAPQQSFGGWVVLVVQPCCLAAASAVQLGAGVRVGCAEVGRGRGLQGRVLLSLWLVGAVLQAVWASAGCMVWRGG